MSNLIEEVRKFLKMKWDAYGEDISATEEEIKELEEYLKNFTKYSYTQEGEGWKVFMYYVDTVDPKEFKYGGPDQTFPITLYKAVFLDYRKKLVSIYDDLRNINHYISSY